MSIKFYTSPKNFIPPKQISGYAPLNIVKRRKKSFAHYIFIEMTDEILKQLKFDDGSRWVNTVNSPCGALQVWKILNFDP